MEAVSVAEAAGRLGVSADEVRKRIRNGDLQSAPLSSAQGIGMGVLLPGDETAEPSGYDAGGPVAAPASQVPESPEATSRAPGAAAVAPGAAPGVSTCGACGGVSDSTATACVWCGAPLVAAPGAVGTVATPVEMGPGTTGQAEPEPPPVQPGPPSAAREELPDIHSLPNCPVCGRANGPGAEICAWCGASMRASPAAAAQEATGQQRAGPAAEPRPGVARPQEPVGPDADAQHETAGDHSPLGELTFALKAHLKAQATELNARRRETQELHVLLQQLQRFAFPSETYEDPGASSHREDDAERYGPRWPEPQEWGSGQVNDLRDELEATRRESRDLQSSVQDSRSRSHPAQAQPAQAQPAQTPPVQAPTAQAQPAETQPAQAPPVRSDRFGLRAPGRRGIRIVGAIAALVLIIAAAIVRLLGVGP